MSVFPRNTQQGLPIIHAAVLVLDANTGRPMALLEGGVLTAIRTDAASGAATDLLARTDSHVAAIFDAGVQAHTQLEAICTVRPIFQIGRCRRSGCCSRSPCSTECSGFGYRSAGGMVREICFRLS